MVLEKGSYTISSMSDFNRHTFPAGGGWTFRQPQTGWVNPMAMVGFDASVKAIIAHRKANSAITMKHNLTTDYDTVADELEKYTKLRLGIPTDPLSFFQPGRNSPLLSGEAVAAGSSWYRKIVRAGTGVSTLADWLGKDGNPVSSALSEERAKICSDCPQNKSGDLLSFFTKPVSDLIRRQLEERKSLKLSTSQDEKLGICDACGCPLKLKVHVPLLFIKEHMRPTESNSLDQRCWILKEQ